MHGITFLQDLAVVMLVAGVTTVIFHRLKQPVVLGYILAGVIIGPHTPPYKLIHDEGTINTLSEMGVIFLMFSLGMEFSLRKLRAVGTTALVGASLEILLMVFAGYELGRMFGWGTMDSIFLGAILSISSTTIIVKALAELGRTREKFSQLIFGILIVEDMLAILMLTLLSSFAASGQVRAAEVTATVGQLTAFLAVLLVAGLLAVPRILSYVGRFKSNEMLLITALGLCFGVSLLTVRFGYSVALGAFLIGAIIAEARELGKIETLTEPIRDMFSAVFFVAIGLKIEPALLVQYAVPIVLISAVVVVGKVVTCSLGTFVAGNDTRTSLRVGMGLAQIGEFSFIIAALGESRQVTSKFLYPIAVAVSAITTLLTPYLIRSSDFLEGWFDRHAPKHLTDYLDLYTQWIGQRSQKKDNLAAKLVRKWILQLLLNTALLAGIFLFAAFVTRDRFAWVPRLQVNNSIWYALLWFGAMVVSLPIFIATARKLQALAMLVADLSVPSNHAGERTPKIRALVARIIFWAGIVLLALLVFLLSTPFWPPTGLLVALLVAAVLLGALFWRQSIKLYSQAQIALEETFTQPPPDRHAAIATPGIPQLLKDAHLLTVTIELGSPAAGKLIRELALRSATGASIVGIQRAGFSIVNPGPDEDILPGDVLLLLGTDTQLNSGRKALRGSSGNAGAQHEV